MADTSWIEALRGNKTTAQIGSLLSADQVDEGSVSNAFTRTAAAIPGKTDTGSKYWFARGATDDTTDTASKTAADVGGDYVDRDNYWYAKGSNEESSQPTNTQSQQQKSEESSTPGISVAEVQGGPAIGGFNTDTVASGAGLLGDMMGYSHVGDAAQLALNAATGSPNTYSDAGKALTGAAISSIAGSNPLTSAASGLVKELAFEEDPDLGKPIAGFSGAYTGALTGMAIGGPVLGFLGGMIGSGLATGSYVNGAIGDTFNTRENEELRDYLEDSNKMSYKESASIADSASRYDNSRKEGHSNTGGATGPTGSSTGKDSKGRNKGDSVSGAEPVSGRGYAADKPASTSLGAMMGKAFGGTSSGDGSGNNVGGEKGSSTGTGGGYNGGNYSGDKGNVSGL